MAKEQKEKPSAVKKTTKKKVRKNVASGSVYIKSTFNNTIVTITDEAGDVVAWGSSGSLGFKGTRKSTPYAAGMAAQAAGEKAKMFGLKKANVFVCGIGGGRETAIRSIQSSGIEVTSIKDVTPIPHNGGRPKKIRRP